MISTRVDLLRPVASARSLWETPGLAAMAARVVMPPTGTALRAMALA